ncbi:MAG: VWA domain-containing protein [Deltaproteobacteria bacterium]|nr:VWA domain-containing protein [Deltaproteobacteria bacterium]
MLRVHHIPLALLVLGLGCVPEPAEVPEPYDDGEPDDSYTDDDDATDYPTDDDDATSDDDDMAGDDDDDATSDDDDLAGDDDDDVEPPPEDGDGDACLDAFEATTTAFVSADDSNSQADPVHNQGLVSGGVRPSSAKAWEYLNYAEFDFAPASAGSIRIEPQLLEHPSEPGRYDLMVAVVAPDLDPTAREPMNLVFAVDTSCSMSGSSLAAAKQTLEAIAGSLEGDDVVSIVQWSYSTGLVLDSHPVTGPDDITLLNAIDGLSTGGGTNLNGGLMAGFELAQDNYLPSRTNRVVLISDGGANAGVTSIDLIAQNAAYGTDEGIFLAGIGVPPANGYNDTLMDDVTDAGKGSYFYVDSEGEAEAQFSPEGLLRAFEVAALDVQLAITLPPGFVIDEFSGEEIGWTPSAVEPQNLSPNDQMLYEMDVVDCSADADSLAHEFVFTVEWIEPETGIARVDSVTTSLGQLMAEPGRELAKARALVSLAEVANAPWGDQGGELDSAISELQTASSALPADPDLGWFIDHAQDWRALIP